MKKVILLAAASFVLVSTQAQKSLKFGIRAGANIPMMTLTAPEDLKLSGTATGFHAGGFANVKFTDHFTVQPNLLFTMKGGDMQEFNFRSYHVDLPINLLYTHNDFYIGGGPNFSYGVSGKVKEGDIKADMYDETKAFTLTHKRFEFGGNVTMGYNFPNGLTVGTYFTAGFNNLYKGDGNLDGIDSHNKTVGFTVGYIF